MTSSPTATSLSTLLIIPTLLLLSLPLLPFALLTSTIAILALLLRATLVYLELATALVRKLVSPGPPGSLSVADYSLKSRPLYTRPLYSFSSSGNVTPRRPSTAHSHSFYQPYSNYAQTPGTATPMPAPASVSGATGTTGGTASGSLERDFEGVGGWRDAGDDDRDRMEDALWNGLNRRLELPVAAMRTGSWNGSSTNLGSSWHSHSHSGSNTGNWVMSPSLEKVQTTSTSSSGSGTGTGSGSASASSSRQRQHKRSWTSGAVRLDRSMSGRAQWPRPSSREDVVGEAGMATSRPGSVGRMSGTMSPEEGLVMATKTKSFTDINARMNVGRVRGAYPYERRKSGSSGSVSSGEHVMMTGAS